MMNEKEWAKMREDKIKTGEETLSIDYNLMFPSSGSILNTQY